LNVYQALRFWQFCRPSGGDAADEFVGVAIRCGWPQEFDCRTPHQPGSKPMPNNMAKWLDIDRIIKNQPLRIQRLVYAFVSGKIYRLPVPVFRHLQKQFDGLG